VQPRSDALLRPTSERPTPLICPSRLRRFYFAIVNSVFAVLGFAGVINGQRELVTSFFVYNACVYPPRCWQRQSFAPRCMRCTAVYVW